MLGARVPSGSYGLGSGVALNRPSLTLRSISCSHTLPFGGQLGPTAPLLWWAQAISKAQGLFATSRGKGVAYNGGDNDVVLAGYSTEWIFCGG
jgi:hypothetical protein